MARPTRIQRLRGEVDPPKRPARKPALGRGLAQLVADTAAPAILPPFRYIPLDKLVFSALNVRKTDTDAAIEELAADIEAHGLITNVVVGPELAGAFGLLDGQRRVQALRLLADQGKLAADALVPALVRDDAAEGREISLATAVTRVALNPADEVEAYAAVVAAHADDAEDPVIHCARRFGRTPTYVAQRLRLAALAPAILDALRDGTIAERAAQAYAAVPDQKLQLQVFKSEQDRAHGLRHDPKNVRDQLRSRTLPADCKQARYVGLDAYLAAGGRAERDLWMLPGEPERLLDPAIVDRLAREKAEAELPAIAERDGFGKGFLINTFADLPARPAPPNGYRLGGWVANAATMSAKPAFAVRPTAIGIYGLRYGGLSPIGWFEPIAAPTASQPLAPRAPDPAANDRAERLAGTLAEVDGSAAIGRANRAARTLLERTAAGQLASRILAQAALDGAIFEPLNWPVDDFVRAIDDSDAETILVAVRIRVPRADWLAAIAEAEDQTDDDQDANDRVTQAEGEKADA